MLFNVKINKLVLPSAIMSSIAIYSDEHQGKALSKSIILYGFLFFIVINPLIAQLGFLLLPQGFNGLSLMQWFQGFVFILALISFPKIFFVNNDNQIVLNFLILSIVLFSVIIIKSALIDYLPLNYLLDDLIIYFKVLFFAFIWFVASCILKSERHARLALICIIVGALIDSSFKLFGYFQGVWVIATYKVYGVQASAGAEGISAKATVGFLITAFVLVWYIFHRQLWFAFLLSLFIFVSIYGTFDRAGQVSIIITFAWFIIWLLFLAKIKLSTYSIFQALFLSLTFTVIFLLLSRNESFLISLIQDPLARWTHELNRTGSLGSGRLIFYEVTWDWFIHTDVLNILLGQGYSGTLDMLYKNVGKAVHTHSDFFDLMSVGGVSGMLLYAYLFNALLKLTKGIATSSIEYLTSFGIIIPFTIMSVITGQLTAPHTMISLTVSLWCLSTINKSLPELEKKVAL